MAGACGDGCRRSAGDRWRAGLSLPHAWRAPPPRLVARVRGQNERVSHWRGRIEHEQGGSMQKSNVHWLQKLMDNTWLLLALGIIIPTLSYTAWGWVEILLLPVAKLP